MHLICLEQAANGTTRGAQGGVEHVHILLVLVTELFSSAPDDTNSQQFTNILNNSNNDNNNNSNDNNNENNDYLLLYLISIARDW